MTEYQNDDYEHKHGRWAIVLNGEVITRYFASAHADEHLARLHVKNSTRKAKIVDANRQKQLF